MGFSMIVSSDRVFQIWSYSVGHSQLLLRSNIDNNNDTRLEVLFKDVGFLSLPVLMNGLDICDIGNDVPDGMMAPDRIMTWYRISTTAFSGYVSAGSVAVNEDYLEYYDPSPLIT